MSCGAEAERMASPRRGAEGQEDGDHARLRLLGRPAFLAARRDSQRLARRSEGQPRHDRNHFVDRARLCVQVPLGAPCRPDAPAWARAARPAARLAHPVPARPRRDLPVAVLDRSGPGDRHLRFGGRHRRLRIGNPGRRDRCLANRRRRRASDGGYPLVRIPDGLSDRGPDRGRACARPFRADQLARRLCGHGRGHGSHRHRDPAGAGYGPAPLGSRPEGAARTGRRRSQAARDRTCRGGDRLGLGDPYGRLVHDPDAEHRSRRPEPAQGERIHGEHGPMDHRRHRRAAGARRHVVQLASGAGDQSSHYRLARAQRPGARRRP